MINFNGNIDSEDSSLLQSNRAFLFGDGVFETLKIVNNKILFLEDHYFRLMASMRIVRMEIPMNFTQDFIEDQILSLAKINNCQDSARVRLTVYRNSKGYYLPENNEIGYLINSKPLENKFYNFFDNDFEIDLYKDFYVTKQLLSSIKSTNKLINITGSIFAKENKLDNCLLMNDSKNIIEALNGNIFMFFNNKLLTPPVSEGCLNGVMRKQILTLAKKIESIEVAESIISPFDLQKADELFITNVVSGIIPITKYRKKSFETKLSKELLIRLNEMVKNI